MQKLKVRRHNIVTKGQNQRHVAYHWESDIANNHRTAYHTSPESPWRGLAQTRRTERAASESRPWGFMMSIPRSCRISSPGTVRAHTTWCLAREWGSCQCQSPQASRLIVRLDWHASIEEPTCNVPGDVSNAARRDEPAHALHGNATAPGQLEHDRAQAANDQANNEKPKEKESYESGYPMAKKHPDKVKK
jgi:hypothetical protein